MLAAGTFSKKTAPVAAARQADFIHPTHTNRSIMIHTCQILALAGLSLYMALLTGCASLPLEEARSRFYAGDPLGAEAALNDAGDLSGRFKLLGAMEKGMILFHLGDYEKSIKALLTAASVLDAQETISVLEQSGTLLTGDWVADYPAEYSERLFVHTVLMMNYLLLYQLDDALVEAKQAIDLYEKYGEALDRDYFSRALGAICYERAGEYDSALIEWERLLALLPQSAMVNAEVYRILTRQHRAVPETVAKQIPDRIKTVYDDPATGALVVFALSGKSPVKVSSSLPVSPTMRISFPEYHPQSPGVVFHAAYDPQPVPAAVSLKTDTAEVAKASLEKRATRVVAKQVTRLAAKEAAVKAVEHELDNPLAADLLRVAFFMMEEADTRCWQTLPAQFEIVKIPLKPGVYNIDLTFLPQDTAKAGQRVTLPNIHIEPGQSIFRTLRLMDGP